MAAHRERRRRRREGRREEVPGGRREGAGGEVNTRAARSQGAPTAAPAAVRREAAGSRAPGPASQRGPPARQTFQRAPAEMERKKKKKKSHQPTEPDTHKASPAALALPRREDEDAGTTRRPPGRTSRPARRSAPRGRSPAAGSPGGGRTAARAARGGPAHGSALLLPSFLPLLLPSLPPQWSAIPTHTHTRTALQLGGRRGPAERGSPSLGLGAPRGRCERGDTRGLLRRALSARFPGAHRRKAPLPPGLSQAPAPASRAGPTPSSLELRRGDVCTFVTPQPESCGQSQHGRRADRGPSAHPAVGGPSAYLAATRGSRHPQPSARPNAAPSSSARLPAPRRGGAGPDRAGQRGAGLRGRGSPAPLRASPRRPAAMLPLPPGGSQWRPR